MRTLEEYARELRREQDYQDRGQREYQATGRVSRPPINFSPRMLADCEKREAEREAWRNEV